MAKDEGYWAVMAIPGVGIRRVFVSNEAVDPVREWADEHSRSQQRLFEMSERAWAEQGGYPAEQVLPDSGTGRPDDPGGTFLGLFKRKGR